MELFIRTTDAGKYGGICPPKHYLLEPAVAGKYGGVFPPKYYLLEPADVDKYCGIFPRNKTVLLVQKIKGKEKGEKKRKIKR